MAVQTTGTDAENIYLDGGEKKGDGGMIILGTDQKICAVLVQQQSNDGDGAVRVTGGGNVEQVTTGPKESAAFSLVLVADNEKVTIFKHSTYWLFKRK
jgi:hypothetical protein